MLNHKGPCPLNGLLLVIYDSSRDSYLRLVPLHALPFATPLDITHFLFHIHPTRKSNTS